MDEETKSDRELEDDRLFERIVEHWEASDQTYGSPRIYHDLQESGETCGDNRVARSCKGKATRGYKRGKYKYSKPSDIAENQLE